jgi:thiamine-phosphate pyrophosphorylase
MTTKESPRQAPFVRDLYVVSDSVPALKSAILAGAAIVQLRDKSGDEKAIVEKALAVKTFKGDRTFLFILNDDPTLAVKVGADGVHIGQDTSTIEARGIIGESMILGKTTHNLGQAREAISDGADYISVGPVFATPTKPGRPAVGLEYVREAAGAVTIPFVTIGGIDLSNIEEVLAAGATTIGVVRAWPDTEALLQRIRRRR